MKANLTQLKPFFVCLLLSLCASAFSYFIDFGKISTFIFIAGCFMGVVLSASSDSEKRQDAITIIGTVIILGTLTFFLDDVVEFPLGNIPTDITIGVWVGYLIGYLTHNIS